MKPKKLPVSVKLSEVKPTKSSFLGFEKGYLVIPQAAEIWRKRCFDFKKKKHN